MAEQKQEYRHCACSTHIYGDEPAAVYSTPLPDDSVLPPSLVSSQARPTSFASSVIGSPHSRALVESLLRYLLKWSHANNRFVEDLAKLLSRLFNRHVIISGSTSYFMAVPG